MESSTSMNDIPPLVDSDFEYWTECLGDYVSVWLQNSAEFLEAQRQKLLQMALCPFLYGVTHNLPEAWTEILYSYGVIEKERIHKTTPLSESELDILEMAEMIFARCSQLVGNKNDLKTILNFIYDVEERSALGGHIDMNYALQEVANLEVFSSMWAPMKRLYERRRKQAHVCIIYYFKLISHHIILYGRDGTDNSDLVKKTVSDVNRADRRGSGEGNKAFNDKDFKLAVEQYSSAIEKDPLNSLLYSNRAQAYLSVCHYRSALCDSKRAIILDPKNSKHYFKAAKSYLELGQLEKAEEANRQSLECCSDPLQKEAVQQQSQEIKVKSKMTKARQTVVGSGSEERELESSQIEYQRFVSEGSNFYLSNFYNRAVEQFKNAIDLSLRLGDKGLIVEESDLMVLWYVYGISCVKTVNLYNLQTAVEKFSSIISRTDTFPAAYYGLGLAYASLKRYKDAEAVLRMGLEKIDKHDVSPEYMWPQTGRIIEETNISTLKTLMIDLLKECMHPPKPDAMCKFHTGGDKSKKEIYLSDPDYKGHIRLECRENCAIEFHTTCWKPNESYSKGKHNWKEMLDNPCPTPGCWGLVSVVYICRPYPEKSLKMVSQLLPQAKTGPLRPKLKMKSESAFKLQRKLEKKMQRKERRQEVLSRLQEQTNVEEQPQNKPAKVSEPDLGKAQEVVSRNIDQSTVTVLHREEPEMPVEKKQKASKGKKKEKKQKQFITLELQFKGDENKERYGIHSLDDNGEFVIKPPAALNPGILPTPGSVASVTTDVTQQPNLDLTDNAVYDFIYNILASKGPMDLHGKELESHLRFLCEEAQTRILLRGGLLNFLGSSPRFIVYSNNIVSIAFPVQQKKNPWEGKSSFVRSGDPQSVWPRQGYGLNPGAKEFVPQEPSLVPEVEDKLADSYTFFPKPAFTDLPKPAEDVDDGFTTVVNKKHSRTRSMHPLIQPEPLRHPVKPSFYNSVDEITLDAPIFSAGRCASVDSVDDADKEEVREGKSEPVLPARRMSSPFILWDDPVEKLPTVSPAPAVGKTAFSPHMMAHTGQGSDASDLSGDDLQRVASPALSSNSGSTSSRAEGSQVSSQRSSQPAPLRPLKAPSIMLPSRGKTKKTTGHLSSRLHQLTLAADGSVMYDGYDEESVSSTASDRDSSCGDPRPHSERFIQTPPTMTLDQDIISTGKLGQGLSATGSHPGSEKYIDLLKVRKGSTSSLDTILSEKTGINAGNPPQKEIWAQKHNEEHLIKNLGFKSEMKEHPKGDCFRDEIDKIANSEDLSSVMSPPQPPIQRPQSRTQTLTQVGSKSENKKPFDAHKFPSNTWGYFNPGEQYETTNKVSVPLSESWGQDQGSDFPTTDFNQDFKGDSVIDSEQANSSSGQSKHNLSTSFQFIPSSEDFGSLESETVPRINPWSSGLDKEYIGSIHSSHRDVTFESDNSLFAPWMNFSDSSSSSSMRPSTYTSSVHTTGSRTNQSFISSVPSGGGISSLTKSSRDFSLEDMPFGHKNLVVNRTSQEKRFNMFSAGAEYKTVQTQTALSGAEVEEVLEKLNTAQALQEATQQKNYELQHALKNCQDQLNQESMLNGKLRSDLKKLNLKVQIAEISAEKWKEDVDQMVKNIEDLKTLNQSHMDRSNELSKQLEAERVKFQNLQTELLKQKKIFALQKLDLGKQEAHQQQQKISAVISQGGIVGKSLLDAAQVKHMELSSYISHCEALKKHTEVNAQRLREDLESGTSTDMSSIEVSPPALPMPLMQANDLPEAASGYGAGSVFKNGLQFPSIHGSDSVIKVMSVPKATSQPLETEDEDAKAYLSMVYGYGDRIDPACRSKNGSLAAASDSNTSSKVGSEDGVDDERKWDSFYTASQKPSSDTTSRLGTSGQVRPHSPAPLAAPSGGVWRGATRTSGLPNLRTPSLQTETTRTASPLNVESQFPHPRIHISQQVQENVQQLPLPQQQPYFERVVERVQESFPSYSRYEIQKMADELIKNNSGPLEGWTYETLASKIFEMILDLEETKDLTNAYGIMAGDLHLANSAAEKKKTFDLQCSICQSELEPEDTLTLSCGHRFHNWCIQHWLQSDRSCPNCRSHALLAEDFPSLM